jgi:uncharacterized protein (DUF2267 family)
MKYEEFIGQVRRRADVATSEEAERATQATLETLAGRLSGNEAAQLAAQLPPEIALYLQPYYAGIGDSYSLDEFFRRISEREEVALEEATYHARVVCALLAEVVSVGEIEDVRAQLPSDFAKLFEVENEGEIPEIDEDVSE